MTLQIDSNSSSTTERLGELIGARLKGSEIIELVSDLGGGKTTFTRGLVRAAGSNDKVASPSFTIKREYHAPRFVIEHFDFYRLHNAGTLKHELSESLGQTDRVVVLEWGEKVRGVLPDERLVVSFKTKSQDSRALEFKFPESLSYLIEGLQ